jgi:RND family efflux transporter MFP subunit
MSQDKDVSLRWTTLIAAAAALLATGAGATYLAVRSSGAPPGNAGHAGMTAPSALAAPVASGPTGASLPDVVVTLSKAAVDRAGITVASVETGGVGAGLRLPGVVAPNAYRQVAVTPLVGGRVTRVLVELGQRVRQGQVMAQVFSPELSEAYTRYTSARAHLDAHERELQRTQKLVEIGAASRQELERIHAEHTAQTTEVQSARSRLELLGVPASILANAVAQKDVTTTSIAAPLDGVVTERLANIGVNVDSTSKLFTVVDLSTVWVLADLYEKDFSRVRVESSATITTTAYPDLVLKGRVSYIDPQVSPDTRTAQLRVEVPNPRSELRLGMLAEVQVDTADRASMTVIPRTAVQNVADRSVVYAVDPREPGRFIEREVRLGQQTGERVKVLSGVAPGDSVVADGSFFLRAERERLGLRQSASPGAPVTTGQPLSQDHAQSTVQTAKVVVGEQGFEPAKLSLRAGVPTRLTFVRTTDKTCATEVVFPSLNIRRTLPLKEPVEIAFTPANTGEIAFACGMNMLRGTILVE